MTRRARYLDLGEMEILLGIEIAVLWARPL